jgi:hypothetical protein
MIAQKVCSVLWAQTLLKSIPKMLVVLTKFLLQTQFFAPKVITVQRPQLIQFLVLRETTKTQPDQLRASCARYQHSASSLEWAIVLPVTMDSIAKRELSLVDLMTTSQVIFAKRAHIVREVRKKSVLQALTRPLVCNLPVQFVPLGTTANYQEL